MRVCFSTALVSYTSFRFGWPFFDAMPPFFSRFVCKMGVPQKLLSATRLFARGGSLLPPRRRFPFSIPRRGLTFSTQRPPGFQNPGGRLFVWGREPALRRASGADWGVQIRSGGFRRGPGSRYSLPQLPAARCSNRPWRTPGWPLHPAPCTAERRWRPSP